MSGMLRAFPYNKVLPQYKQKVVLCIVHSQDTALILKDSVANLGKETICAKSYLSVSWLCMSDL